jgi:hypothetical protein
MDGWMSKEEEEEEKSFVLIDFWFESWWRLGESIPFGWITRDLSNQVWFSIYSSIGDDATSRRYKQTHTHTGKKVFFSFGRKKVWFFLSFALSPVSASVFVDFIFGLVLFPLERLISFAEFYKKGKNCFSISDCRSRASVVTVGLVRPMPVKKRRKEKNDFVPPPSLKSNNESMTLGLVRHRTN